jgi:hypothetical protein
MTNEYAFWEITEYGSKNVLKETQIFNNVYYLLIGNTTKNYFFPSLISPRISLLLALIGIYRYYVELGMMDTDGVVPLTSQINFLNQNKTLFRDQNHFNAGQIYYSVENANHIDILQPENDTYAHDLYLTYLKYLNFIENNIKQ